MMRRYSLDVFDQAMYPELRVNFDVPMNVIRHYFHGYDFRPVFLDDFSKHLSASFLYRPCEYLGQKTTWYLLESTILLFDLYPSMTP